MNILLIEIFAGTFVSIACWDRHSYFPAAVTNLPKLNSFACTLVVQCYTCVSLVVVQTFCSLMNEWREYIFASFYFRVCDLTREIRKNKNLTKISTYTVCRTTDNHHKCWKVVFIKFVLQVKCIDLTINVFFVLLLYKISFVHADIKIGNIYLHYINSWIYSLQFWCSTTK